MWRHNPPVEKESPSDSFIRVRSSTCSPHLLALQVIKHRLKRITGTNKKTCYIITRHRAQCMSKKSTSSQNITNNHKKYLKHSLCSGEGDAADPLSKIRFHRQFLIFSKEISIGKGMRINMRSWQIIWNEFFYIKLCKSILVDPINKIMNV